MQLEKQRSREMKRQRGEMGIENVENLDRPDLEGGKKKQIRA